MKAYEKQLRYQNILTKIVCDCCGEVFEDRIEHGDFLCWSDTAGYGSPFGDGNSLKLDLCRACVQKVLGDYVRTNGTKRNWSRVHWHEHLYSTSCAPDPDIENDRVLDAVELGDEFLLIVPATREIVYGGTCREDILQFAKETLKVVPWHELGRLAESG